LKEVLLTVARACIGFALGKFVLVDQRHICVEADLLSSRRKRSKEGLVLHHLLPAVPWILSQDRCAGHKGILDHLC